MYFYRLSLHIYLLTGVYVIYLYLLNSYKFVVIKVAEIMGAFYFKYLILIRVYGFI